MSMFGGYPYPTAGRHHDGGQQPMELTVTIRLDVEVHPAFTEEQLLHDLTLQIATLSEPEPRRKPGRIAWHVTGQAVHVTERRRRERAR